jgi:hypothetical protein
MGQSASRGCEHAESEASVRRVFRTYQAILMDELNSVVAESPVHHVSIAQSDKTAPLVAAAGARAHRKTPKQVMSNYSPLYRSPLASRRYLGRVSRLSDLQRAVSTGLSIKRDAEHEKHFGVAALAIVAPQNHSVVRKDDPLLVRVYASYLRIQRPVRYPAVTKACSASKLLPLAFAARKRERLAVSGWSCAALCEWCSHGLGALSVRAHVASCGCLGLHGPSAVG